MISQKKEESSAFSISSSKKKKQRTISAYFLGITRQSAPVTRAWAEEIGADGYAEDAVGAVREADRLMGVLSTP